MKHTLGKPVLVESAIMTKLERDLTRATSCPWYLRKAFIERTYRWALKTALFNARRVV